MFNRILSLVSYLLVSSLVFCLICVPTASTSFSCGATSFGTAKSFGFGGVMKWPTSVAMGDFNGSDYFLFWFVFGFMLECLHDKPVSLTPYIVACFISDRF